VLLAIAKARHIASLRSESFTCDNYLAWTLSMPAAACARAAKDPLELMPEDARQLVSRTGSFFPFDFRQ
jgi:hypothetical protein